MTTKGIYKKEIKFLTQQIIKKFKPKKIILYGSCASGKLNSHSDIDMLIIKNTKRRFIDRISDVLLLCDYDLPFEPIVYTPKEIDERLGKGDFFIEEIIKKGRVLYG